MCAVLLIHLQDGTTLVDVASHLNQMQIIDALGTAVDEGKTPLKADTGYQVLKWSPVHSVT